MVNEKKIASFIDEYSTELKIHGENLTWPKKYGFNLFDISLSFEFEGKKYVGRGTSKNGDKAVIKAFSESVEHFMVSYKDLDSSNGTAVHFYDTEGRLNAKNEFFERDIFLSYYLVGAGLNNFRVEPKTDLFKLAEKVLGQFQIEIFCYRLSKYCSYVVLSGLKSEDVPFGVIVGSSYDECIQNSQDMALIECLRDGFSIIENGSISINLERFQGLKVVRPQDHLALARDLDYGQKYLKQIQSGELYHLKENLCELSIDEFSLPNIFEELPLIFYHAHNEKYQNLYFGETKKDKVNFERLKNGFGLNLDFSDIVKRPHPFG